MNNGIFYAIAFATTILGSSVESFCSDSDSINFSSDLNDKYDYNCMQKRTKFPVVSIKDVPGNLRYSLDQQVANCKSTASQVRFIESFGYVGFLLRKWKKETETPNNKEIIKLDIANSIIYFVQEANINLGCTVFDPETAKSLKTLNPQFYKELAFVNSGKRLCESILFFARIPGEWQKGPWNSMTECLYKLSKIDHVWKRKADQVFAESSGNEEEEEREEENESRIDMSNQNDEVLGTESNNNGESNVGIENLSVSGFEEYTANSDNNVENSASEQASGEEEGGTEPDVEY